MTTFLCLGPWGTAPVQMFGGGGGERDILHLHKECQAGQKSVNAFYCDFWPTHGLVSQPVNHNC